MQRLRPLSEAECYARCYGDRDDSVTLLEVAPHVVRLGVRGESPQSREEPAPEQEWTGWAALVPFPQRPA